MCIEHKGWTLYCHPAFHQSAQCHAVVRLKACEEKRQGLELSASIANFPWLCSQEKEQSSWKRAEGYARYYNQHSHLPLTVASHLGPNAPALTLVQTLLQLVGFASSSLRLFFSSFFLDVIVIIVDMTDADLKFPSADNPALSKVLSGYLYLGYIIR